MLRHSLDPQAKRKSEVDDDLASFKRQKSSTTTVSNGLMQFVDAEPIKALNNFKDHFGMENFFNIFRCFY